MTYEVVKVIGVEQTHKVTREAHLVKLTEPAVCRQMRTFDLYEVDHVIVEALRINESGVTYEETHVVASDEDGAAHDAILYQATKALTVQEAMFSIGKHLTAEHPHNDHIDTDTTDTPEEADNGTEEV